MSGRGLPVFFNLTSFSRWGDKARFYAPSPLPAALVGHHSPTRSARSTPLQIALCPRSQLFSCSPIIVRVEACHDQLPTRHYAGHCQLSQLTPLETLL